MRKAASPRTPHRREKAGAGAEFTTADPWNDVTGVRLALLVVAACDKSPSAPEREYPRDYSHITAFAGTGQAGLGDEGGDPLASALGRRPR